MRMCVLAVSFVYMVVPMVLYFLMKRRASLENAIYE